MRAGHSQRTFADLALLPQGLQLAPCLQRIADFLDAHGALVQRVQRDLTRGLKRPRTGRSGMTAQQVLRSLILMRVKNWDYRELRERIADGYTLRVFTRFDAPPALAGSKVPLARVSAMTAKHNPELFVGGVRSDLGRTGSAGARMSSGDKLIAGRTPFRPS
jgi:hypothetical protein